MSIVTIGMIVDVNRQLADRGLSYKVHLSDACGSQSMRVEPVNDDAPLDVPDEVMEMIDAYFAAQRMAIEFSPDRHAFWVPWR